MCLSKSCRNLACVRRPQSNTDAARRLSTAPKRRNGSAGLILIRPGTLCTFNRQPIMSNEATSSNIPPPLPALTNPDFELCSPIYGENILYRDCLAVITSLAQRPPGPMRPTRLPIIRFFGTIIESFHRSTFCVTLRGWVDLSGTCHIRIDVAGPSPSGVVNLDNLRRQDVVDMALWVLRRCVMGANGSGGFVTKLLQNLVRYSLSDQNPTPFPSSFRKYYIPKFRTLAIHRPPTSLPLPSPFPPFKASTY